MRRRSVLATSCATLAVLLTGMSITASEGLAAEWVKPSASRYPAEASVAATRYFADRVDALSLRGVDLRVTRTVGVGPFRTVRFRQTHAGLPVLTAGAAVRVAGDGTIRVAVLELERDLTVSPLPVRDASDAIAKVAAFLGRSLGAGANVRVELAVLTDIPGGRRVWVVDAGGGLDRTRTLVDDDSGRVVGHRPLATDVLGRVYAISSAVTPTPEDLELLELSPSDPQVLTGWGGQLKVTNYVSGDANSGDIEVEQSINPNAGTDFLFDPPSDPDDPADAFAQVNVYYHLTRARDFFADRFGVDFDQPGWDVTAVANMLEGGQPMDNAFFSPYGVSGALGASNMIGLGQGSFVDFSYDSDVFIHEFGHYVAHNAVGYSQGQFGVDEYGLSPWGGGIDEGLSDYFACTLNGDPILGEATLAPLSAERDLTNTSKRCPDDIQGEVHADGEIVASLAWTIRDELGAAVTDQLVFGAMSLLTPNPSLSDFGRGLLQTADDLVAEGSLDATDRDFVATAVASRGLDACDKVLDLPEGVTSSTPLVGLDYVGQLLQASCEQAKSFGVSLQSLFHYKHTSSEGAKNLRVAVELTGGGGGEMDWSIYVRKNEHVTFAAGGFLPVVDSYDYAMEHLSSPSGELVIDEASSPPFDPTATYYFVLVHANCPNREAHITAGELDPPIGTGGAGGDGGGGGAGGDALEDPPASITAAGGGCACRAAESSREAPVGAGALLSLALWAGLARRRRRARA